MSTEIKIVNSAMERKELGMKRYGVAEYEDSLHREFIMLRGSGCGWAKCTFCDYCVDKDNDAQKNYSINRTVLAKVTGKHKCLQVVSSGSFSEMDFQTIAKLQDVVKEKGIKHLILETHTMYESQLSNIRSLFPGVHVAFIIGAETFEVELRNTLNKGHGERTVEDFAEHYQWTNILFGFEEENGMERLTRDVELAMEHFERFTICVFCDNDTSVKRDPKLIDEFYNSDLFKFLTTDKDARFVCEIMDDCDSRAYHDMAGVGGVDNE